MAINAEVAQNENENSASILRRFTRRVQGSGVLTRIRGNRFFERTESKYKRKLRALKRLERRDAFHELQKLGKIKEGNA